MPESKRITVIHHNDVEGEWRPPDGKRTLPSLHDMKEIVGGWIEVVTVLKPEVKDRWEYTLMIVNETGLIDGLPRNQKATDIYLENMRRQYPGRSPGEARRAASAALAERHGVKPENVINAEPEGYADDPHICGDVLYFAGWTREELLEAGF